MIEMFSGLSLAGGFALFLALAFVLFFEFINGFHDTANAVATVIYTRAMPPHLAVICSGIFNFFGVILGGLGVAYAIVHLLPVDLLLDVASTQGMVMVFSLLAAAILWNFGTWYLALPASSSHTLIGSILGVGLANALLNHIPLAAGVNWKKAIDVMLSLLVSPTVGFLSAALVLWLFIRYWPTSRMHKTPDMRQNIDGKKHPPFWTRLSLVGSAMGMSFVHGSNDGQKGIGLLMLVLIGIVPGQFVVNLDATPLEIQRAYDSAVHLEQFYARHGEALNAFMTQKKLPQGALPAQFKCEPDVSIAAIDDLKNILVGVTDFRMLDEGQRRKLRRIMLCLDDTAKKASALPGIPEREKKDLKKLRADLTATTEYAPQWVVLMIALALGLGTMVGWKRVVKTVGEKIGQKSMTYGQGACAQGVAVASIGLATFFGLPVSTTHVLSSGVAGTMVANKSGLQKGTVRHILIAWALTMPAAMVLSAAFFYLGSWAFN